MILRVEKEIFRAESGYTVLNCDELDEKGTVIEYGHTVTGIMLPEVEGTKFEAEVETVKTQKYGEQLKVLSFTEKDPDTLEGVVALILASKLKGVGKKTAEKIVEKFGLDTIKIMDTDFSRLKTIRGMRNLEAAEKQWKDSRAIRELMQIVGNNTNIGPTRLLRIKKYFKDDVADVLRNHPYRITEVRGVSFHHADTLARNGLVFDPNDNERIQAGIRQALINAMDEQGHMFLTGNELVRQALVILNRNVQNPVSEMEVKTNTNELCKTGALVATNLFNGSFAVYLKSAYRDEAEPVEKIMELLTGKLKKIPANEKIMQAIKDVEQENGIELAEKQRQAIVNGITNRISIITGGPGKGKTTTLNLLLAVNERFYKRDVCLMAPTGRAARRMKESTGDMAFTIHSKLNLKGDDEEIQEEIGINEITENLVIIDEMSMVDSRLFSKVMKALKGNSRVVLVGDVDQLPSVGAGNVFAELINSGVIPTTVLDVPFRQAEEDLIYKNANLINEGNTNLVYGENFKLIPANGEDEISEICCNLYGRIVDEYAGDLDRVSLLTPFRKRTKIGANEINLSIRDKVNNTGNLVSVTVGGTTFRQGDKVMQLKNISEDISLSNGDVGYIKALSCGTANDSSIEVTFNGIGDKLYETREELEMLDLAYASTIHKSQGSEVDVVIMPMSLLFSVLLKRNLVYTGVSRAKAAVYIVGDEKALKKAILDNTYAKRNTLLSVRLKQEYNKIITTEKKDIFSQLSLEGLLA